MAAVDREPDRVRRREVSGSQRGEVLAGRANRGDHASAVRDALAAPLLRRFAPPANLTDVTTADVNHLHARKGPKTHPKARENDTKK